jgi:hypothetical protein
MTLQQETRIKYLEKIKKDLCESVARKYAEHLLSIPKDLQSTLTMQEFINDYHGNVQEFLEAASAPKSKRYFGLNVEQNPQKRPKLLQKVELERPQSLLWIRVTKILFPENHLFLEIITTGDLVEGLLFKVQDQKLRYYCLQQLRYQIPRLKKLKVYQRKNCSSYKQL